MSTLEQVVEATRESNLTSSRIGSKQLTNLERFAANRPHEDTGTAEIVVVSVPDLRIQEDDEKQDEEKPALQGISETAGQDTPPPLDEDTSKISPRTSEEPSSDRPGLHTPSLATPDEKHVLAGLGLQPFEDPLSEFSDTAFSDPFDAVDTAPEPESSDEPLGADDMLASDSLTHDGTAASSEQQGDRSELGDHRQPKPDSDRELRQSIAEAITVSDGVTQQATGKPHEAMPEGSADSEPREQVVRSEHPFASQIAHRLLDSASIRQARTVLFVASGPLSQFRDAVEDIVLEMTAETGSRATLTAVTTTTNQIEAWPKRSADTTTSVDLAWRHLAAGLRVKQVGQVSVLELLLQGDLIDDASRELEDAFQRHAQTGNLSVWLTNSDDTKLTDYLTGACDATIMLVDLNASRVENCRLAVTQLREHGARLLGTIVINDARGGTKWELS